MLNHKKVLEIKNKIYPDDNANADCDNIIRSPKYTTQKYTNIVGLITTPQKHKEIKTEFFPLMSSFTAHKCTIRISFPALTLRTGPCRIFMLANEQNFSLELEINMNK